MQFRKLTASNLISREQQVEAFNHVVHNGWSRFIELPLCRRWQHEEHPNVKPNDENDLEDDLSEHVLAQVKRTINDDKRELNDQHQQKGYRDFVLFEIAQHTAIALLSSERGKAEKNHEEVDEIAKEKEAIDVGSVA